MALSYYSNDSQRHSGYSWYYFPVVSGSAINLVVKNQIKETNEVGIVGLPEVTSRFPTSP